MGNIMINVCERNGGREIIGSLTTVNEVVVSRLIWFCDFCRGFFADMADQRHGL